MLSFIAWPSRPLRLRGSLPHTHFLTKFGQPVDQTISLLRQRQAGIDKVVGLGYRFSSLGISGLSEFAAERGLA
jgi:hypothetical protein